MVWWQSKEIWRYTRVSNKNEGLRFVGAYPVKTRQAGVTIRSIRSGTNFYQKRIIRNPRQLMYSSLVWILQTSVQYDGPRDIGCRQWQSYWNFTYGRPYFLSVQRRILAWITATRMTPICDGNDLALNSISFSVWFINPKLNLIISDINAGEIMLRWIHQSTLLVIIS